MGSVDVETTTGWSKTWSNLPTHEGGKEIVYSVVETLTTANGYTSDTTEPVTVENGGSQEITNSYIPEVTEITVTKTWDDANDQDGKRSGVEATITLKKTVDGATTDVGSVDVETTTGWSKTWSNLPTHEGGKEIVYSVVETLKTANGYTSDTTEPVTVENGGSQEITNSYTPEKTEVVVSKEWKDNNNQSGVRPEGI